MNRVVVYPGELSGHVQLPGDKSVSQRVAILASLACGTSEVKGYLDGEDAQSTLAAMVALGASVERKPDGVLFIRGVGGALREPLEPLYLGNSGTGTRLLAGLLAGAGVRATLMGDASLSRRPMGRIEKPLSLMGADLQLTGEQGTLPIEIGGGGLKGITYEMPMASAQVKSCVLLAGLFAEGETTVVEPRPTRDHTEKLFETFGIPVRVEGPRVSVMGYGAEGPVFEGRVVQVPGDFSSAAFWLVAAAAREGAVIEMESVGLNPRRTALLNVLKRMGADVHVVPDEMTHDPVGRLRVKGATLRGTVIEGDEIPNLIDELPILAVAGALAMGETVIRDAAELRVKESDRIAEMVKHLRSFGVSVDEFEDGLRVKGGAVLKTPGVPLSSDGDHRIAMSMAILNTFANGALILDEVGCVDTSYPSFWSDMVSLGGRVDR
ncbi:MAG: 3-phosphoshikimate 1-carboxyvinyltransferase [Pontiellaceae bacterium]